MIPIVRGLPPNFAEIKAAFPQAGGPDVIFSFGSRIYGNPPISPALMAHETVHCIRQQAMGVEMWWSLYIHDKAFRLAEELLAHKAEFRWYQKHSGRVERRQALAFISHRLASPLYGKMITIAEARRFLLADDIAHELERGAAIVGATEEQRHGN